MVEATAEAECVEPLAGQRQARLRQFDSGVIGAGAREIDSVGTDATADLQHTFARPALKLGKIRYVRFNKILARLDLVKVFPGPEGRTRMPDIAGPPVPIRLNGGNIRIL